MGILKHVPVWRLSFYTQGCAGVPCLDTVFILNLTSLWVPGCILSEFGHLHPHSCQFGSSCCFPIDKNGTTCTSLCGQTWPSHKRTLKYPGGGGWRGLAQSTYIGAVYPIKKNLYSGPSSPETYTQESQVSDQTFLYWLSVVNHACPRLHKHFLDQSLSTGGVTCSHIPRNTEYFLCSQLLNGRKEGSKTGGERKGKINMCCWAGGN